MAGTRDALDSLAPWDAAPYFDQPKETVVTLVANTPTLVIAADPNRVALIFCGQAVGTVTVSLNANTDGTTGLALGNTIPPVKLLFSEVGPLVQQAWWGWSMGTPKITVYAVSLSRWPRARLNKERARRASNA